MPRPTQTPPQPAKILCVGESGSGKTGALIALAAAGYKIRVLDTDNGSEIITHLAANRPELDIIYETVAEKFSMQGKIVPQGNAWTAAMKLMDKFPVQWDADGNACEWEKISSWGSDTVFVLDTLTRLGEFAMANVLALDNKTRRELQHWGMAINMVEQFLQLICGAGIKCHVIINTHVKNVVNDDNILLKELPNALGNKLPDSVASFFNTTLLFKSEGSGAQKRRKIYTKGLTLLETKTPAPNSVKASYPQETGLAEYFNDLFGPLVPNK